MTDAERCIGWPDCTCGQQWRHWQRIDDEGEWLPDGFQIMCAELAIGNLLDCVAHRCPDPAFRKHALQQLKHPRFSMSGHVEG